MAVELFFGAVFLRPKKSGNEPDPEGHAQIDVKFTITKR
jgi:hypothetical protein